MSYADSPVEIDTIQIDYRLRYLTALNTVSPAESDNGFGERVGYLDPADPGSFPIQMEEVKIDIGASYQRVLIRDLDFGQPSCWTGFESAPSGTPFMTAGFDTQDEADILPEIIFNALSPGQFVAIASCCAPGVLYILGRVPNDAGTYTQKVNTWQDNGGTDIFGLPTYTADEDGSLGSTADMSASPVVVTTGTNGKNWPGGELRISALFYLFNVNGGIDLTPTLDNVTPTPIAPWDLSLGSYTVSQDDSLPAVLWEQKNWSTGGTPTGVTTLDGALTYTQDLTISFGGAGGGGNDPNGLASQGLTTGGLTTGSLQLGSLDTGSLDTGSLDSGTLTTSSLT